MKNKKAGLGRESLDHSTNPTESWPTQREIQSKDCLARNRTLGRNSQTLELYDAQSLTGGSLERVAFSQKLRRILNNEWREAVSYFCAPCGE